MKDQVQYTIRNIPLTVDAKLKAQAKRQGVSLNKLLLKKIGAVSDKESKQRVHKDLRWMWKIMPLEESRQVDEAVRQSREADKKRAYAEYQAEKERGEWQKD